MKSKTRNSVPSTKILEATRLTVNLAEECLADELTCLLSHIATIARSIEAMTESPVYIKNEDGKLVEGFNLQQVRDVGRLAIWIDDIATRAVEDFDRRVDRGGN